MHWTYLPTTVLLYYNKNEIVKKGKQPTQKNGFWLKDAVL